MKQSRCGALPCFLQTHARHAASPDMCWRRGDLNRVSSLHDASRQLYFSAKERNAHGKVETHEWLQQGRSEQSRDGFRADATEGRDRI